MRLINLEKDEKSRQHQGIIKESNIKQIFDLVFEQEGISRIEISRITRLSRSTVSILMNELLDAGIIKITGERESDSSGRKPIGLEINGERAQIITLSLRKNYFNYILYDLRGKELDQFEKKTTYKKGCSGDIWKNILTLSPHLDTEKLLAICVSIPAKINKAEKSINLSILDTDEHFDILGEFKNMRPEFPLVVVNQSSARAYAEYQYVFGGKTNNMIYFNFDDGIGAGIMINDQVFTGEIGHMSINPKGSLCTCGKRGCLENSVGKAAILGEFAALVKTQKTGLLYRLSGASPSRISYEIIRKALEQGDREALEMARKIAEKIALGISNVICMFDSEKIIIGGSIPEMGNVFIDLILKKIKIPGISNMSSEESCHITQAGIEQNADHLGVLRFFLDRIFTISTETENSIYLGD